MFRLLLLLSLFVGAATYAQTPAPATPPPGGNQSAIPLFRAQLPGGLYEVAVRSIVAVSTHEYLVDGAIRVVEMNIDTNGSTLVRFYYIEPNTPNAPGGIGASVIDKAQQLFTQAADKTGQDVWKKVVKNYPTTTHARTVEYRLESREEINKVYEAAEEAFRLQKTKSVKIE
jgi:hypothetical protein